MDEKESQIHGLLKLPTGPEVQASEKGSNKECSFASDRLLTLNTSKKRKKKKKKRKPILKLVVEETAKEEEEKNPN